jgi:hypothetical protein
LTKNQSITETLTSYHDLFKDYKRGFIQKLGHLDPSVADALLELERTSQDPEEHIKAWTNTLHLFPDKRKPPRLLDKTFDESHLRPKVVELLRKGEAEIKQITIYKQKTLA